MNATSICHRSVHFPVALRKIQERDTQHDISRRRAELRHLALRGHKSVVRVVDIIEYCVRWSECKQSRWIAQENWEGLQSHRVVLHREVVSLYDSSTRRNIDADVEVCVVCTLYLPRGRVTWPSIPVSDVNHLYRPSVCIPSPYPKHAVLTFYKT